MTADGTPTDALHTKETTGTHTYRQYQ